MRSDPSSDHELRVLVCAGFPRDAELTRECLVESGIECAVCDTDDEMFDALSAGAGAVVLAQERLGAALIERLRAHLDKQPAWSDLPLVVMVAGSKSLDVVLDALRPLGNVTTIDRPARRSALVSVVRSALRARQRQYDARGLLARLSETDKRKDAFIAMLGHELRNPLSAIHGAATLLETVPDKGERLRRVADILGRQVAHLQRLVDDLLDVARITAGKIVLKRQRVDARSTARQVVTMLDHMARERRHRLDLDVPDEEVVVDVDPVRLEQMLGNLIHNAMKYTPDGGSIRVIVEAVGSSARLRVIDDGRGLAPESIEHIFEPFTQVDSSIDRRMGGLGVGLPLVRGLASLHGGTVEAKSEGLGRGSEFVITLPLEARSATIDEPRTPTSSERSLPTAELRVLLVDDFLDVLDVLRLGLEHVGCDVDTATDGLGAVERATSGSYDVAFVDIGLPGIDGFEVARRLRADPRTAGLPLVAMSGYGQEEDRRRSAAAGFDDHLVKPVDVAQLMRAAERSVKARPSRP